MSQDDEPDDASISSSEFNIFEMQKTVEDTILKNSSLQTKALNELAVDFSESAAEIMLVRKRKAEVEDDEDSGVMASISSKDRSVARVFKRAHRTTSKNSGALSVALALVKEIRRLSEVRNEILRLQALTQIILLRQMDKATSFLSAAGTSPPVSSAKSARRSSRIASQPKHRKHCRNKK
ncbi:hypothetical protein BGZ50_007835 [Haplosporangium sp. Z 11]|nr:hypothetical protein BGZ50_007835 [Haplosporangium sp. Z 11]